MSIAKPNASITLNGDIYSAAEAGLVRARVDLGFNTHDRVHLVFWPQSALAGAAPGDELSLSLSLETGDGGLLTAVPGGLGGGGGSDTLWTGTVQSTQSGANFFSLDGLASTSALSDSRRSQTWEDMSVGDIVSDLAGELSTEVEADLKLASFSIDNTRSVWSCLYELAQLAGAELSCAADGGVRFILSSKETGSTELRYGVDLIEWKLSRNATFTAVGAAEHGAASSAGGDKWHWLAHDPVGAGGDPARVPAAFRTRDAATAYSDAASARATRAQVSGDVWLGGRPELRPGSWVELKDLPQGDSGPLRVKAVTHQLDGVHGLITALHVEGGGGGGGGLGL